MDLNGIGNDCNVANIKGDLPKPDNDAPPPSSLPPPPSAYGPRRTSIMSEWKMLWRLALPCKKENWTKDMNIECSCTKMTINSCDDSIIDWIHMRIITSSMPILTLYSTTFSL